MYSFTTPRKKPFFKEDTKLWLIFIFISTLLYTSFALFLLVKAYFFNKETQKMNREISTLTQKITNLDLEKNNILLQKSLYEDIVTKNEIIKQSVKNLLDLVPDPITLTKFKLNKNTLIIYGITPTKDVYNLLMLPPLESIFEETKTYFYQMPNGWYKFKSINKLKSNNENT